MTTTVETFDKVDGSLGPVLTWANISAFTLAVVDQQCHAASDGPICYGRPTTEFGTDVTVSVVAAVVDSSALVLEARVTDYTDSNSDEYYVLVGVDEATASYYVAHYENSIETVLVDVSGEAGIPEGSVISFEVIGDTLRVLIDAVEVVSVVDPSPLTGTYVGLGMNRGTDFRVDTFTVVAVPALGTMFMPPSFGRIPTTVPRGTAQWEGTTNALMRNYRPRQEGTNVFLLSNGEVTETDPDSVTVFWDKSWGSPYVQRVFWGSTADPYELTTVEAQALDDAGYILT